MEPTREQLKQNFKTSFLIDEIEKIEKELGEVEALVLEDRAPRVRRRRACGRRRRADPRARRRLRAARVESRAAISFRGHRVEHGGGARPNSREGRAAWHHLQAPGIARRRGRLQFMESRHRAPPFARALAFRFPRGHWPNPRFG